MYVCCDSMVASMAKRLMHDVYTPFSACIWLNEKGKVVDLYQFDTVFCKPNWDVPPDAHACLLISNHPDGYMQPREEDIENWRSLNENGINPLCRLFIYAEDEGIAEIVERRIEVGDKTE